ncbi:MAG: hypothetical protein ACXAAR_10710 [Candidatus Thorarchaeota archaeon]
MKPIELVIVGAGDRGTVYASYATENPHLAKVVGVAEPREFHRQRMVDTHGIPPENVFTDWKDLSKRERTRCISDLLLLLPTRDTICYWRSRWLRMRTAAKELSRLR